MKKPLSFLVVTVLLLAVASAGAQQAPPPPYGSPITLDQAKKVMAGAEAEAKKNNWNVAIAIHDSGGNLVMLQRLDGTQFGSTGGANLRLLKLSGATPLEGGIPIIVDGKLIGSIGVSGVTSQQDAQIAKAGAD